MPDAEKEKLKISCDVVSGMRPDGGVADTLADRRRCRAETSETSEISEISETSAGSRSGRGNLLLRRMMLLVFTFAVIYLLNFFIPRLMPGDPFRFTSAVSGEDMDTAYNEQQLEMLRQYYGFDQPLPKQFANTLFGHLRGDFGQSIHFRQPVAQIILERLPWSLGLMLTSLLAAVLTGSAAALLSIRFNRFDRLAYSTFSILSEIPAFLLGILLLFTVALRFKNLPLSGGQTPFAEYESLYAQALDLIRHAFLPWLALSLVSAPAFYFTARASFLSILRQPYLEQAKAKAVPEMILQRRYILRNGLAPVITRFFLSVATAVGGTLMIENVFAYPGIGRALREAVIYRDYPLIQGILVVSSAIVLTSLFFAELLSRGKGKQTDVF